MTSGDKLSAAGQTLVGCRFRLHGRDPENGLDCVGVVAAALERAGFRADLPNDYAMRSRGEARAAELAGRWGFVPVGGAPLSGDVLLIRVGPCQSHFVLCVQDGNVIHAHASLRRVVRSPSPPDGNLIGQWRLLDPE